MHIAVPPFSILFGVGLPTCLNIWWESHDSAHSLFAVQTHDIWGSLEHYYPTKPYGHNWIAYTIARSPKVHKTGRHNNETTLTLQLTPHEAQAAHIPRRQSCAQSSLSRSVSARFISFCHFATQTARNALNTFDCTTRELRPPRITPRERERDATSANHDYLNIFRIGPLPGLALPSVCLWSISRRTVLVRLVLNFAASRVNRGHKWYAHRSTTEPNGHIYFQIATNLE